MDVKSLLQKNRDEIREDETRKQQALTQFREWLDKHPFIIKCRKDDAYLLHFLRTKKYSMDDVFKIFEAHHLFRAHRPEWFETTSPQRIETIRTIAKTGASYMLRKRADDGSLIFVVNFERFTPDKFSVVDGFNFVYNTVAAYMADEDNQLLGCTFIMNYYNCPLKNLMSFSVRDSAEFAASANKCAGRYKKYILVGLPAAANAMLNAAKTVMTEKQRNRLLLIKDHEELAQHIDKSCLTEILGGTENESEVIEEFLKIVEDKYDKITETNDIEVDMKKAAACRDLEESIGSFRTLEID
ncbi:hypothetical protein PVAND_012606 [Polypedilum vanderplanki]|uniref:CRAL-TRIO domain-containing protein n=1 Tax=Polypedilum vanderplanki TaxID=319348 RepID=A0A9J6CMZ6_POLVA|nr:hypothetical protein PVAND_012606 [Polypedilum vanderplanki]